LKTNKGSNTLLLADPIAVRRQRKHNVVEVHFDEKMAVEIFEALFDAAAVLRMFCYFLFIPNRQGFCHQFLQVG
jgi:hypothetical protein